MFKSRKYLVLAISLVLASSAVGFAASTSNTTVSSTNVAPTRIDKKVTTNVAVQNITQDMKAESKKEDIAEVQSENKDSNKKPEIIVYVVESGDTLEKIAKMYGINARIITESNGIDYNSVLTEGEKLRFPSINGVLYKIKNGETLWDISTANDVDVQDIISANSMGSPDNLKIDQEIIIPGIDKIKPIKVTSAKPVNLSFVKTSSTTSTKPTVKKQTSIDSTGNTSVVRSSSAAFIWPLMGTLTSGFGPRGAEFHKGIDIAAPTGTDLKAAADGTVIYSGWMNGFGNYIKIRHENGVETYYGHNSINFVNVGQKVSKGQVIAKLGNTGKSTGPHVEFGITNNGSPVNPLLYLK